ncbi:MAG: hypothetical protein HY673_22285 [Chloroflexi bacterium]|nr:hypothetical protein [Chloroflexota bacterium]
MTVKSSEYQTVIDVYKSRRKEMDSVIDRMLDEYREPRMHPREMRRKLAKQIGSISVSRMMIEAR